MLRHSGDRIIKALIIIDVQNDFVPGGSLAIPEGDIIVPAINRLQDCFDIVIATQDWHPPNHLSFASNHPNKKPFDKIELNGIEQTLWPDHCVQGTTGADFPDSLVTRKFAAIFRKGMTPGVDSYSGFYDNNHEISTGLSGYLREKGIKETYYCGLAADICVYYTIKDSLKERFHSTLIEDASQSLDREAYLIAKKELMKMGAQFMNSSEFENRS